jgi:hypothetical protein
LDLRLYDLVTSGKVGADARTAVRQSHVSPVSKCLDLAEEWSSPESARGHGGLGEGFDGTGGPGALPEKSLSSP